MAEQQTKLDADFKMAHEKMVHDINTCVSILSNRASDYGNDSFIDSANIFMAITGKGITPHEIALVMLCTKLARYGYMLKKDNKKLNMAVVTDTIVDAMNYLGITERERLRETLITDAVSADVAKLIQELRTGK
jgi:hypothetical protein